jgi:hypothetical protein
MPVILISLALWIFKISSFPYLAGAVFFFVGCLIFNLLVAAITSGYTSSAIWVLVPPLFFGFDQAHPFICEVSAEERDQWIRDIEKLQKLDAKVIIPGHQEPGMSFDSSSCDFTKNYLIAIEKELARTNNKGRFYNVMAKRFPDATLPVNNEINAGIFKGGRECSWKDK